MEDIKPAVPQNMIRISMTNNIKWRIFVFSTCQDSEANN